MRTWKCLVAIAISCLAACAETEGQCWLDEGSPGGPGAGGGGPIVPGGGGYGDDPGETPQGASDGRLYFDCNVDGPCESKCLDDFVAAADECAKIQDGDQRKTCQSAAYVRYMTCRQGCQQKENDCLEHRKDLCVTIWESCDADCGKDRACKERCIRELQTCFKECEKKCK